MNRALFLLTIIVLAGFNTVSAQILEEYKLREELSFSDETTVDIFAELPENRKIAKGALYVSFDFGERIVPNFTLPSDDDEIFITFSFAAYKDGDLMEGFFGTAEHSLAISRNQPEVFFIRDFPVGIDAMASPDNFPNEIKVIVHNNNIDNYPSVSNILRFGLNYEESYGVDCAEFGISFIETENENPLVNEIAFKWTMEEEFPGSYFQLQVLRLFNENAEYANDDGRVETGVNWDDAGTYILKSPSEIEQGRYQQLFTISEGTGFYLWRIRPVSHFFKGGLANPLNFGEWSMAPSAGDMVDYSLDDAGSWPDACFHFVDLQSERNYSYSRVFTEHGKNKELVTYANRLNQVRQKSTYLPSENVSVVTQTVLDHTGRPALVTLPVPVDGKNLSYHSNFVTTPEGELYQARHFDQEDNFQNPSPVSGNGDFKYYENNSEDRVASAEGYPFTRTIFYNDGSGRVREESGVGKTHRIHDGSESPKRTTRYLYESATATELEALFGHETPDYESVYKKITIDPNQVASVAFINKDGQTIATGLSYSSEFESSALEELDGGGGASIPVRNEITQNTKTGEGFVSSKRIYVPNAQPLSLDYRVELYQLEQLCISQDFDCNYELFVSVTRILDDNSMEDVEVDQSDLELSESEIDGTSYMVASTIVDLPAAGTYVIEKKLIPQGLEMSVSANTSVINGQVMPLVSFFTDLLDDVKTREELDDFFEIVKEVSQYLNSGEFSSLRTVPPYNMISGAWWNIYEDEKYTDLFSLGLSYLDDEQENISAMQLSTPCCQNMIIPVNWEPPFDCSITDRNNDGDIDLLDVPDFEGYMIDVLYDAIMTYYDDPRYSNDADKIRAFYVDFLPGWDETYGAIPVVSFTQDGIPQIEQLPGVVNEMVYHMLTDIYPGSFNEEPKVQYDCEEIFECWSAVVAQLHQLIAPESDFDYSLGMQEGGSVSTAYIDEHEGNEDIYEKGHDKHFNTGLKGGWFFTRWLAKRKVSKKMRRLRVDPNVDPDDEGARDQIPTFHLVKAFLDCAGYKFAKILTPFDAVPIKTDIPPDFDYTEEMRLEPPVPFVLIDAPPHYYTSYDFNKSDGSKFFLPDRSWRPIDEITEEPLFPNVRNPFYAFKYFYYDMMGNPKYQALESSVCFVDPNDCYQLDNEGFYIVDEKYDIAIRQTTPCCYTQYGEDHFCYYDDDYYGYRQGKLVVREFAGVGRVKCPYTYENWSSAQRFSFFRMIADYRLPEDEDLNFDDAQNSPVILNDFVETNTWYFNTYQSDDNDADPYLPGNELEQSEFRNEFNQIVPHDDINLGDDQFIFVEKEMHDAERQCLNECEKKRDEFRRKLYEMLLDRCYTIGGCRTNDPSTWDVVPEEDIEMMINAMVLHCREQCDMNTFSAEQIETRRLETPLTDLGPNGFEYKFQYGMGGMPNAGAAGYDDDNSVIAQPFTGARENIRYLFDYNKQPYNYNLSWYQYTAHKQVMEWDFEITLPSKCEDIANQEADYPSDPGDDHFLPRKKYELNPNMIPDTDSPALNDPVVAPSVLLQRSGGPGFDDNGEPEE